MPVRYYKVETDREKLATDFERELALHIDGDRIVDGREGPPITFWQINRQDFSQKRWYGGNKFSYSHLDVTLDIPDEDLGALRGFFRERCCRVLDEQSVLRARYKFEVATRDENIANYWASQLRRKQSDFGGGLSVEVEKVERYSYHGSYYTLYCLAEGEPAVVHRFRGFVERENKMHQENPVQNVGFNYDFGPVSKEPKDDGPAPER